MAAHLLLIRQAVFGIVLTFSVIVLGVSSHLTYLTNLYFNVYFNFAALAIATAVMSIISLLVIIVIDFMRKGAVVSMIAVELGWLSFLWILWLATGASAADATRGAITACNYVLPNSDWSTACHEYSAIQAFAFLNWIVLMGYTSAVLVLSIVAVQRGQSVWFSSVRDFNTHSHSPAGKDAGVVLDSMRMQQPSQHAALPA